MRRRTDLLFAGFIMMAMTNLALLLLFGVRSLEEKCQMLQVSGTPLPSCIRLRCWGGSAVPLHARANVWCTL